MRLPERYKQIIYIQNETHYGSDIWGDPYPIRGIVTPVNDTMATGGISVQGNTDDLKFESYLKGVAPINQNSKIWIKRKPNPDHYGEDNTHIVIGRSPTTNGQFVTIHVKSVNVDVPIL